MQGLRALAMVVLLGSVAFAAPAETTLYRDDLAKQQRTRIDAPRDDLDSALDAALGGATGFTTKEIERIGEKIRAELKRERPRATPRLMLFLYPGKTSIERLKTMAEIAVDIELVMDPCDRSVCKEAIGSVIEMVGRAVGSQVVAGSGYKLRFQTLILQTSVTMHDEEMEVLRVPVDDCIRASQKRGGGAAWVEGRKKAGDDFVPIVTRAIAKRASEKRVELKGAPRVSRSFDSASVVMSIAGDRNRFRSQVLDALAAAAKGLADNPTTPVETQIEVRVSIDTRGTQEHTFRCQGSQVALWISGRLDEKSLWNNYVAEQKAGDKATRMTFDDASAKHAGADEGGDAPDDNEAIAVLGANFTVLAQCVKGERAVRSSFRGATLMFSWTPSGRAENVQVKEPQPRTSPLLGCFKSAMDGIRLPRFSGQPRTITYPMLLK